MAMNQLVQIGGESAGVIIPKDELRDEGLVEGGSGNLDVEPVTMRVTRFSPGAWQVLRTDQYDFPAFHEKPAYAESAKATV